ncbi:MAG: hypothetical protein A2138_10680 [Deltaproteobacteria bacterium RBG_16_71_12]|nr:MAG: hypothetical protein A2138_10680 [Deltaproteobacteria bacterium RBG_16_71_12]
MLDATRKLVRERGFTATTTKEIAKACELSEATLFWYFQSKDEIFTSLLYQGIELMRSGLEEIATSKREPRHQLAQLWRFFAEVREQQPEYFHVFGTLANPAATAAVSEDVKAEILRRSGDNLRRCAELVRACVGAKDARIAADLFWAAFVGLMVLRDSRVNLGADAHPDERELRVAFELLLEGVAHDRHGAAR